MKELGKLYRWAMVLLERDPKCALCVRGWALGTHVCPESVVISRLMREAIAAPIREVR